MIIWNFGILEIVGRNNFNFFTIPIQAGYEINIEILSHLVYQVAKLTLRVEEKTHPPTPRAREKNLEKGNNLR